MASTATRRTSALRSARHRSLGKKRWGTKLALVTASLIVFTPFLWMMSLAFTPEKEAFGTINLIPKNPTLGNFSTVLFDANLMRALLNSAIVAILAVAANCFFAILAGYAFAMLPFPKSTSLFYLIVSTTAIPGSVTLIPLFLIAKNFPLVGGNSIFGHGGSGLLDTLAGVVLPYLVMPMNIFLARQFFSTSPIELAEAARIDGASEWRIFARIYLPLAKPLVAVVAIFTFTGVWSDFLWPLVVTTSTQMQTVQLALARFLTSGNVHYGPLMAGTVIVTLPVLLIFIFNQRNFISGLSDGSIKG